MKIKCIIIDEYNQIPTLTEIEKDENNVIKLDYYKYSNLNGLEISKNNIEIDMIQLEENIYMISISERVLVDFDKDTKWYDINATFKNIKFKDKQLWGDVLILKIVNEKIYELSLDEIDKYIDIIKKTYIT